MKTYELVPTNGRQSYGHKAVVHEDGSTKVLYSYATKVCYSVAQGGFKGFRIANIYDPEKKKLRRTTMNHIEDFLYQIGVYSEKPSDAQILKDFAEAIDA